MTDQFLSLEKLAKFIEIVNTNHSSAITRLATGTATEQDKSPQALIEGLTYSEILEAATCLATLIYTPKNVRELLGVKHKPGGRKSKLSQTIDSEEFGVVVDIELGNISYSDGEKHLIEKFQVDRTTAQRFIADRRQSAKEIIRIKKIITREIKK